MNAAISDARRRAALQSAIDQALRDAFATFQSKTTADLAAMAQAQNTVVTRLQDVVQQQQALIEELSKRRQAIDLGLAPPITIGSTLAITTASTKRWVLPLAGVRPSDVLFARPDEYLPEGYGLPQVVCRNAGQIEVRIATPTLTLGTTKTISLAITALR